ncbi:MAG: transglutaminase-like domain-containing protein [Prevotellaceae bacterium]|nr:transglutaminase-like domain-containing protein [Prevotellaceae bacterium]
MWKILIGAGAGLLAVLFWSKLKSLTTAWDNLIITPKLDGGLSKLKLTLTTLTIPVAVDFGNRSDQTITVQVSAFDIFYNNKLLAQNQPTATDVQLLPNSARTLAGLKIDVSNFTLISVIGDVVKNILANANLTQIGTEIINKLTYNITVVVNKSIVINYEGLFGNPAQQTSTGVSGLGLVPAGERDVIPYGKMEMFLPPKSTLEKTDLIVIPNGSVEDTVRFMQKVCKQYNSDTTMLANALKAGSIEQTLHNFFDFIFTYIKYVPDSKFTEQVRRPARCLWDKKGDCDCFSTLIGSMCENLGIPYKFRIAEYDNKGYYQHVYVVVPKSDGTYWICDPVVDRFNYEKTFTNKKDF